MAENAATGEFRAARDFLLRHRGDQPAARDGFRWLVSPDVPADMVFVDNLAEAICRCLEAPDQAVMGEQARRPFLSAVFDFFTHLFGR